MNNEVILVKNLSKTYDQTKAVDDVSFQVQAGEIFGLLGPNGAGKSTLLQIIVGEIQPDSGAVVKTSSRARITRGIRRRFAQSED